MKKLFALLFISSSLLSTAALAVSSYIPLHASNPLESQIEKLAAITAMPNLKKPYSLSAIKPYLAKIKNSHPVLHQRIKKLIRPYEQSINVTHAHFKIAKGSDNNVTNGSGKPHALANARGETVDSQYRISTRGHYQYNDHLLISLGTEAYEDEFLATGSMLSFGWDSAQFDLGYREHWYSPFQQQAKTIGTQAETMLSATISNPRGFENWWNFQYELFVAQMDKQPVLFNNAYSQKKSPYLVGTYLSLQPLDFWTVSISRTFQMGGGERDTDLKDFIKAFVDPSGNDNTDSELATDEEAGNQLAAVASQFKFDGPLPFVVAFEMATEDTSKTKWYLPGNAAFSAGVYFPLIGDNLAFNYEFSDWQNRWYAHHLYQQGYRNNGNVLGHWALNDLIINEKLTNGQSHNFTWQLNVNDSLLTTHIKVTNLTQEAIYDNSYELNLEYLMTTYSGDKLSFETTLGEDFYGESFWQFGIGFIW